MLEAPDVLILTPVKQAARHLSAYAAALARLSYPPERLSLGLLEGDSQDDTWAALLNHLPAWRARYRRAQAWQQPFGYILPPDRPRWDDSVQLQRRAVLAKSRNALLFRALADEDWVLWLDVDVIEYPADIIQRLLATGKDIVQPHCVKAYGGPSFDRNAWRDQGRLHLDDLRAEGPLVRLDAVGGAMLLVRAAAHRAGLVFPPFRYGQRNARLRPDNGMGPPEVRWRRWLRRQMGRWPRRQPADDGRQGEIETEGFGLLAHDMGYECWGMPWLEVKHAPF